MISEAQALSGAPLWQQIQENFRNKLPTAERAEFDLIFNGKSTMDDILKIVRDSNTPPNFMKKLEILIGPLNKLGPVMDVRSNVNGLVRASIWGPLKLIIQVDSPIDCCWSPSFCTDIL